ncbi:MAG: triose-phosphate isomerase [Bacilli bacterium]|nr:triose-phosphate isomerase [Bacilli bacterium]
MENKIIIANLKMYMDAEETSVYLKELKQMPYAKEVIYFPSALYVPFFIKEGYRVGIQNISTQKEGAYTGEIAAGQAASLGVKMVLIGHHECRNHAESESIEITKKIERAVEEYMQVILCIGESLEEEENTSVKEILQEQLQVLNTISKQDIKQIMIAYEPVWAVGTGRFPSKEVLQQRILWIKEILEKMEIKESLPLLYGGSISKENIEVLCSIKEVNGFLIGKDSTDSKKLSKIIEVAVTV